MRYDVPGRLPELLAPAGSFACLKAAVQNGADAVYLGLKAGSARMGADNFTLQELEEAVGYAHIRGVRVYLAFNTIFFEDEIDEAYETAKKAAACGIDALILQDLGLLAKICENRPAIPCALHASTQMSIYNEEGLNFLKQFGFERCIAARELSIREIRALCEAKIMEVEVFCHGALCMSLSGQCLLSSFLGGRSGNRGTCAQPCRKKYALEGGVNTPYAYRLSPTDFAALPHIGALLRAGVRSLKIEGRLKSPAYTALATRCYRQALDGPDCDITGKLRTLQLLFGRGEFTSGYLLGKLPFKDITLRSAGRLGLPVGQITEFPRKLPSPETLPPNLTRFRFAVRCDSSGVTVKPGDGITIYAAGAEERRPVGGGTVNAVQAGGDGDPRVIRITAVGTLGKPGNGPYDLFLTEDAQLRAAAETGIEGETKKIPVRIRFWARAGETPRLEMEDAHGCKGVSHMAVPAAQAVRAPTGAAEIRKQLAKLGDTPYCAETIEIDAGADLFLPVSALNALRRSCAQQLSVLRAQRRTGTGPEPLLPERKAAPAAAGTSLFFYRTEGFFSFTEDAFPAPLRPYRGEPRTYYIPLETFYREDAPWLARLQGRIAALRRVGDCKIVVYFPLLSLGEALAEVRNRLAGIFDRFCGSWIDGFLCENPGDLAILDELSQNRGRKPLICCDYSFNAANSSALRLLGRCGANRAALSPEAAPDCIAAAAAAINPEIVVGGRIVLMRSRHCYIDEGECGGEKAKCAKASYFLKDEYGCRFPILPQKKDCCSILLSHKPVSFSAERIQKIRSVCPEATLRVNLE